MFYELNFILIVAGRGVEAQSVTVKSTGCAMLAGLFGKWGTERFNTMFPLSTLLYAGYSLKL